MRHLLLVVLLALSFTAGAIVVRDDVSDAEYRVPSSTFPALVDMPGEGQGVLVAPRWVVTAAHATQGYMLMRVRIHGKWRDVAHLFLYPGVKKQFSDVRKAAEHPTMQNAPVLMEKFEAMHDIALIELAEPVEDVKPVSLYRGSDEQGEIARLFGKGATGNGKVGEYPHSPHRGKLRRAYNKIVSAHAQWLDYVFDCGRDALPLEGVMGDGDSGGPLLIQSHGQWKLAGLSDWKHWPEGHSKFAAGVCGQRFSNSRISYYVKWISQIMASHVENPGT